MLVDVLWPGKAVAENTLLPPWGIPAAGASGRKQRQTEQEPAIGGRRQKIAERAAAFEATSENPNEYRQVLNILGAVEDCNDDERHAARVVHNQVGEDVPALDGP